TVAVLDGGIHVRTRGDGVGERELTGERVGLGEADDAMLLRFHPVGFVVDEPAGAFDVKHIGAERGDALQERAVQALDGGAHESDGYNADHDPESGQYRAQFVGADGVPGDAEALAEFDEDVHDAAALGEAAVLVWSTSLAIRPSRIRMTRCA